MIRGALVIVRGWPDRYLVRRNTWVFTSGL
jgi:hypothetical protein